MTAPADQTASEHPVLSHFPGIRQLLALRHQLDFPELERALTALEADVRRALAELLHRQGGEQPPADQHPATVTITATTKEPTS